MKRALLGILCGLLLLAGCKTTACAEEEEKALYYVRSHFDWRFGGYLWELYDENKDNRLSEAEVGKITELDLRNYGLDSVRGIKYLTNLKKLDIRGNDLTALDVSENIKLTSLKCSDNYLTELNVSKNTKLKTLWCSDNMISKLNLSKNTLLTSVKASNNDLGYLDLTNNTEITEAVADNNVCVLNMKKNADGNYYYDLSTLTNFNVSKASNFSAGTLEGSNLVIPSDVWEVTYTYKMRKGFSKTFTLHCFHPVKINKTNFPDDVFRKYVSDNLDTNPKNGSISYTEAAAIDRIDVDSEVNLSSLQGIEHFFALKFLDCYGRRLTKLDVSKNRNLQSIRANQNKLEKLDVSKNVRLKTLQVGGNPLTSINVKNLKKLYRLEADSTHISSLDLSNNHDLQHLNIYDCPEITALDVSSNKWLCELDAAKTSITSIDLSNNDYIADLDLSGCPIKTINVSNMPELEYLYVTNCGLQKLNVKKNPELRQLECGHNELTTLDLSANSDLQYLECDHNKLTALDLSKCANLYTLDCSYNQIVKLTGLKSSNLWDIDCSENELDSLSVSKITDLTILNCSYNNLTKLNLSNNTELTKLDCSWNDIDQIDLSKNTKLTYADVHLNPLKTLDVSNNTKLTNLVCRFCHLASLDLTNCSELYFLDCRYSSYYYTGDRNNKGEFVVDLTTLPGNFDVDKAGNWSGGTVEGTKLTIPLASSQVTYSYDCGQGKTVTFKIIPGDPKFEITSQPKDVTVNEGEKASFRVEASTTVKAYQWQKSTDGGATWEESTGAGALTATKTLTAKVGQDGWLYRCVLKSWGGKTAISDAVKLTVKKVYPQITEQPSDVTVKEGEKASFHVTAQGDGLTYQWQYSKDGENWTNSTATSAKTDTMTTTTKMSYNGRYYRCIVANQYGNTVASDAVILTVDAKTETISILTQPSDVTVAEGAKASFTVKASSDDVTYQWQKSKDGINWSASTSASANAAILKVTAKTTMNGQLYRCVVTDKATGAVVESAAATLHVQ